MTSTDTSYPYIRPRQILFTDDFSRASERAIGYARAFALRFGSHLVVAHVDPTTDGETFEQSTAAIISDSLVHDLSNTLRQSGVQVNGLCSSGPVVETIERLGRINSADILVLGMDAPHGLERLLIGSCAQDVVTQLEWPMILVGPKAKPAPMGAWKPKLIFSLAESASWDVNAAVYGYHLARETGALYMLFAAVYTEEGEKPRTWDALRCAMAEEVPEVSMECAFVHNEVAIENVAARVTADARAMGVDAIVMSAGLPHAGGPSHEAILSQILQSAPCPVVVVPPVQIQE